MSGDLPRRPGRWHRQRLLDAIEHDLGAARYRPDVRHLGEVAQKWADRHNAGVERCGYGPIAARDRMIAAAPDWIVAGKRYRLGSLRRHWARDEIVTEQLSSGTVAGKRVVLMRRAAPATAAALNALAADVMINAYARLLAGSGPDWIDGIRAALRAGRR